MYKDEGGNVIELDEKMNKRIIDNDDISEDNLNRDSNNIIIEDNTINIPPQAIPPSEE